ncbi:hypothetical protein BDV09DRAFT_184332 [Aspergillus tetrazonus]
MSVVQGIETRDANGKPYLRQNIDKWYMKQVAGDRIQLTLFMEALALIQRRDLDDLKSYFRLAAIHSAPWCEWDDVPQPQLYIMLYERTLYEAMHEWIHEVVPESHKDVWRNEADKWRLPYWDFARFADRPPSTAGALPHDIDHDRLRLPILCMMPNVRITVFPKDSDPIIESRPNPLYKYITPKLMGEFHGGQNWLRPNSALNEHSNFDKLGENPYGLDSWGAFSSVRYTKGLTEAESASTGIETYSEELHGKAKNALNLEFIHNNVHASIHLWGAGHMSSIATAAFDPIFFIYHNNIDRLAAMWQILNWEKWFDDDKSKLIKDNELTPFHKDADRNLWKSDDEILIGIETLYGKPTKSLYGLLPKHHGDREDYVITVVYDKFALNGAPYKINLFLDGTRNFGGPDSEGFIASIYNFSGSLESSACGNCKRQKKEGVKCIAQVPATPVYLAMDSWGTPVQMDIHIELHKSRREYYKSPLQPDPNNPLEYNFLKHGKQAPDWAFASTRSGVTD